VGDPWRDEAVHLAEDGTELARVPGLTSELLCANSADGSCWVTDAGELVRLASDGSELERMSISVGALVVRPLDGSLWVTDSSGVRHLAEDGTELWRRDLDHPPDSLSLNPADGSCWVGGYLELVHLAEDGTELWRCPDLPSGLAYGCSAVIPSDGSVWVVEMRDYVVNVVHLATDGTELGRVRGFLAMDIYLHLAASATDGSCWIVDQAFAIGDHGVSYYPADALLHVAADGTEIWRIYSGQPSAICADPYDNSCWIGYAGFPELLHLAGDGTELGRLTNLPLAWGAIAINPTDHSLWVGGGGIGGSVWHVTADGQELWRRDDLCSPNSLSVNPADASCWIAGSATECYSEYKCYYCGEVAHLAEDGSVLFRIDEEGARTASVDPNDGSCWVATGDAVIHFAESGAELRRIEEPSGPVSAVSVDPFDGSCWVAAGEVVHLNREGDVLWRGAGDFIRPEQVSVSPFDGTCWVAGMLRSGSGHGIVHISADGTELWRGGNFVSVSQLSASWTDGSCWVRDLDGRTIARLVVVGGPQALFPDTPVRFWAYNEIGACLEAGIVVGYTDGLYHPGWTVTRDQMAVYIARALVSPSGDAAIADPEPPPSFPDVPSTHWAYKHIEYAVSQNVVKGYDDGTYQPGLIVDRGTMAVYIARAMVAPGGDAAIPGPVLPATFPDVPDTFWAYKQVEYCVGQGVVNGYEDGLYHPEIVVTRDQMAVYIARAFGLL
jgi:hypothetical protein